MTAQEVSSLLGVFAGVLLHEAAHLVAAKVLGLKVYRVRISWRRVCVQVEATNEPWSDLLIAASGPAVNLLLAAACSVFLPAFGRANLLLGWCAMIPFPGSDGRRILSAWWQLPDSAQAEYGSTKNPPS